MLLAISDLQNIRMVSHGSAPVETMIPYRKASCFSIQKNGFSTVNSSSHQSKPVFMNQEQPAQNDDLRPLNERVAGWSTDYLVTFFSTCYSSTWRKAVRLEPKKRVDRIKFTVRQKAPPRPKKPAKKKGSSNWKARQEIKNAASRWGV